MNNKVFEMYKAETGRLVILNSDGSYTDEYVNWLERKCGSKPCTLTIESDDHICKSRYTVRRCKSLKDNTLYGPSHATNDICTETLCGSKLNERQWWITDNNFTGEITCKKCNKILDERS